MDHADQLVLGEGRRLEMQPAHGSLPRRQRVIILDEIERQAGCLELAASIDFGKKTAVVAELQGGDQLYVADGSRLHANGHVEGSEFLHSLCRRYGKDVIACSASTPAAEFA